MRFLRDVEAIPQDGGGFVVTVNFNANDNLSMGFIRGGIENEMAETYETLFTSGEDVRSVVIGAYFTLVDNLGNETEELVYRTRLNFDVAQDINWANAAILNWPEVWITTDIHPELAAEN